MSYQDPYGQNPYGQSPYGYYPPPARTTNGLSLAAMIVSIISLALCAGAPGIVGAIMGHVGRRQVRERGEEGDGFALAGIIVGWIGFGIFVLVILFYVGVFAFVISQEPTLTDPSYDPAYPD
jgi:MFS family permease